MTNRLTPEDVAAEINKKFPADAPAIVRGSDLIDQTIRRIPTGILALDVALGGGWPSKQWSEVYGDESVGKTFAIFQTIRINQQLDPEFQTVWVAAEEFVAPYAKLCGVDLSRVHLIETNLMEDALDRLLAFIESRSVDLAVIDSLPALLPKEESEKTVSDLQVALQARITGKFFRKVRDAGSRSLIVEDRPVTGLIVNQYRVKVGGWAPHGQDPHITPGGKAKNFAYFCRVALKATDTHDHPNRKQNTSRGKTTGLPVGYEVRATVIKNKTGPQGRIAVYDAYTADNPDVPAGYIDEGKDLFMTASMLDVITRRGAFYYLADGSEDGVQIARGRGPTYDALKTDPELQDKVRSLVLEKM